VTASSLAAQPSVESLAAVVAEFAENPASWRDVVHFEPDERWWTRLYVDDTLDVWLLTWVQDTGTDLHDHGASAGAFAVVEGTLEEIRPDDRDGALIATTVHAGDVREVSRGIVHDVRSPLEGRAVSIHAYSPPLAEMTFYETRGSGPAPTKTVSTHPERTT
jgi:predicted metal-dependent enzyme (double-stranded beta helix superfamily)